MSKRKSESNMSTPAEKSNPSNSIQIVGDAIIGKETPLQDYKNLITTHVAVEEIVDDEIIKENVIKISSAARDVIWELLFSDANASDESQKKATDVLEEYKSDACFYQPWPYNEWIVKLRDELLKRKMLDFWRNSIVKKQLGPCWHRDSDLFDGDDEPPLEFYAHAGCTAPFAASVKVRALSKNSSFEEQPIPESERKTYNGAALSGDFEVKISMENALVDYQNLMKRYVLTTVPVPDEIQKKNIAKISQVARETIWKLLFEGTPEQPEFDKAAELLQEYKGDAGFYGPWEFNEWIVKLRDEVLERNLLEFWGQKIVAMELGPCCVRDSEFFESEDPVPLEFYEKAGFKAPFDPKKEE
ncbi:uncharacterized protein LOC133845800 [Drosophila sulfurigaster albostrigata]|uniref:uncharacterized protein LOC133845800 n=1 Tax=Drosophila sulfurigaster albostrigata TaxID=89887 RepID=UPI002D21DC60|nr:uncharacterized protein LOC133845800 [Drosophila sulfurigaster albostrigata]